MKQGTRCIEKDHGYTEDAKCCKMPWTDGMCRFRDEQDKAVQRQEGPKAMGQAAYRFSDFSFFLKVHDCVIKGCKEVVKATVIYFNIDYS